MARPPIFESYSSTLPPPGDAAIGVSKPAVFGFFFSIMFCLPVLSGLAAVILGTLGLLQIRRKEAIGRPVAIAAIVIGAISILLWGLMIGGISLGVVYVVEIQERAVGFIEAMAEGDTAKARLLVSRTVSDEKLEEWREALAEPETEANAMLFSFTAGDPDSFDFWKILSGPYFTTGHVQYRPKAAGQERPRPRQVWLSLAREDGDFRVVDMTSKVAPTTLPFPDEFFEQMQDLKNLEELHRLRVEPVTRPSTSTD